MTNRRLNGTLASDGIDGELSLALGAASPVFGIQRG
jgi:hypothetical protein